MSHSASVAALFFFTLTLHAANAAETAAPIGTSAKDAMFAQEKPFIVCNDPIKDPACAGLCTDMKVNYDEMRNINGRDVDPKRGLAKPEWYDLNGLSQRKITISKSKPGEATEIKKQSPGAMFTLEGVDEDKQQPNESSTQVSTYEIGNPNDKECKWATVWIHGDTPWRGGLGVADNIFGGSFNRMKHLAQDNHGLYYSPSVQDFDDPSGIAAVIQHIRTTSCPKGKIIMNCGSAGTYLCWQLAQDKNTAKDISGMVLIGSGDAPEQFANTEVGKARVPILFTQGEHDNPDYFRDYVNKVHKQDPTYPIRFLVFKDGGHMTPLRMLDWKSTMNCMMTQAPGPRRLDIPYPAAKSVNPAVVK